MEKTSKEGKIAVYITGEVVSPGVYYIESDSRIIDLLEVCGGLTDSADLAEINLAEKVNDSDKIDIPKKINISELDNPQEEVDYVDNSCLVNINTASKEELKELEGIGDTLAQNIINYRKKNKFESIEDILNVNGIGQAKFEQIKEYICVK